MRSTSSEYKGNTPPRPTAIAIIPEAIPEALKEIPRWVGWRYVEEKDLDTGELDWDKPPFQARNPNQFANSMNPKTWAPFSEAIAAYERGGLDGVGFVLDQGKQDLIGLDLDKCRDSHTGVIESWALGIVREVDSYSEVSPSGCGLRIFCRGKLPPGRRRKGRFEIYDSGRYVTVTGNRVDGVSGQIEDRSEQIATLHRKVFGQEKCEPKGATYPPTLNIDDDALLRKILKSRGGARFGRLWNGSVEGHGSPSEADLALCNYLAFWCGPNRDRIDRLFRQSGLFRAKWQRDDYRDRTIDKALDGRTDYYDPAWGKHKTNGQHTSAEGNTAEPILWEPPLPFGVMPEVPPFPTRLLSGWLAEWIEATATATQTPPDLAGMLSLAVCGAALAKRARVIPRPGWSEPVNIFTVVALPPGDRKSTVFAWALKPVQELQNSICEQMRLEINREASKHRVLEKKLKHIEDKLAKAGGPEFAKLQQDQHTTARELTEHKVPIEPQLVADDATVESLAQLLAAHGRMLQAGPEGTPLEILKGRYSDKTPNFDAYLKGHAGDPLTVNRVGRGKEHILEPALSLALAVQPDVIRGLADQATLKGRGFLARLLFSLPVSRVGRRLIAAPAVPQAVQNNYHNRLTALWQMQGQADMDGKSCPYFLHFSPEGDGLLQDFERRLEPQLAEGEELSFLAGWANKLAGACVRIAGILHVAEREPGDLSWQVASISPETVDAAVRLGQDYLLPHALAAFGLMGADERVEDAQYVLRWISENCVHSVQCVRRDLSVSKRNLHRGTRGRFKTVDAIDPAIDLLVKHEYLRPEDAGHRGGPGRKPSPTYLINPHLWK